MAPVCPLCNQVLPFKATERNNPNDVVERHISNGSCPSMNTTSGKEKKPSSVATQKRATGVQGCGVVGCEHKALIKCKNCRKNFCVE